MGGHYWGWYHCIYNSFDIQLNTDIDMSKFTCAYVVFYAQIIGFFLSSSVKTNIVRLIIFHLCWNHAQNLVLYLLYWFCLKRFKMSRKITVKIWIPESRSQYLTKGVLTNLIKIKTQVKQLTPLFCHNLSWVNYLYFKIELYFWEMALFDFSNIKKCTK